MRTIPLYLAVISLSFAACAQHPVTASQTAPAKQVSPAVEAALPKLALTNQLLYQFLVAEIAGQRGELGIATGAYLDLAQTTRDPRIARRATEVALYAREARIAQAAARLWLEIEPDSVSARKSIAALLVNDGKLGDARPYLEKLIAAEGDNAGAGFMHLNALLVRQKDKQAALELVKSLAAPYPNLAEAHYAIAQAATHAGRYDEALAAIKTAARFKPGWELAALHQFELLQRAGKADGVEFLKDFLRRYPDAKEVRLTYARQLVRLNQFGAARQEFRRLALSAPGNPEMSLAIGLLSLQLNELDAAEAALQAALQQGYADAGAVQIYLGQVAEGRKRYADAAKWYQSVAAGNHYLPAQIRYAALLARQGKLNDARAYLRGVKVEGADGKIQLIQAEAQLLRDVRDYNSVFDVLSTALAQWPDSAELRYDRAMAAERLNKLDVMEQDLRLLIKLKPDHAHALNALGYTLADRTERLAEALELLGQALRLSPDDPFILDSMGWAQYRLGNLARSQEFLQRAYSIRPDPEIAAHLGEVLWVRGNRDEARKLWQSSLERHPQNEALLDVMQKFGK